MTINIPHLQTSMLVNSSQSKILIVDDDPAVRQLISRFFSYNNYEIEAAAAAKYPLWVLTITKHGCNRQESCFPATTRYRVDIDAFSQTMGQTARPNRGCHQVQGRYH